MNYIDLTPRPKYYIVWAIDKYGFVDFYMLPN